MAADDLADDDAQASATELHRMDAALARALRPFTAPHEDAGYPLFAQYFEITALLNRACQRMQDVVAADPTQHARCVAMLEEAMRALAPASHTSGRTH